MNNILELSSKSSKGGRRKIKMVLLTIHNQDEKTLTELAGMNNTFQIIQIQLKVFLFVQVLPMRKKVFHWITDIQKLQKLRMENQKLYLTTPSAVVLLKKPKSKTQKLMVKLKRFSLVTAIFFIKDIKIFAITSRRILLFQK